MKKFLAVLSSATFLAAMLTVPLASPVAANSYGACDGGYQSDWAYANGYPSGGGNATSAKGTINVTSAFYNCVGSAASKNSIAWVAIVDSGTSWLFGNSHIAQLGVGRCESSGSAATACTGENKGHLNFWYAVGDDWNGPSPKFLSRATGGLHTFMVDMPGDGPTDFYIDGQLVYSYVWDIPWVGDSAPDYAQFAFERWNVADGWGEYATPLKLYTLAYRQGHSTTWKSPNLDNSSNKCGVTAGDISCTVVTANSFSSYTTNP